MFCKSEEWQVNTMKLKRSAAAFIAAATAVIPFSSGNVSLSAPLSAAAEEQTVKAALPQWIPSDFGTALEFRNTYGATHIQNGFVCIVFSEKAGKVSEDDIPRYDIRTTEGIMKELKRTVYTSSDSDTWYEVAVYSEPQKQGKFEAALVDTWLKSSELDLGYNHAVAYYSFDIDEGKNITETDIYSWLPDCITEYKDYKNKNGSVSAKDEFVVFCLDYSAGTQYKWFEASGDNSSNLQHYLTSDCSRETAVILDGGSINELQVYKAEKDGSAKIVWNYAPSYDYGEVEVEKTLIADCTVTDGAKKVTLNDSYVNEADFSVSQYSIYSGDLTVSSYSIYNKFAESKSAVITSKDELKAFLKTYLNEKPLDKFVSQYSDSFFENNVLMLNTYLDPYQGRIFKHGLKGVQYKDGKLVIDFTSVINAQRMRTSCFDILKLTVPKEEYKEADAVWQNEEILNYDLKRISVIDEDTGEPIEIPYGTVLELFGNTMKYVEGSNPYYWDVITSEWEKLDINEEYLPYGYVLSKTDPKEVKNYGNNTADIIFKVKKKEPVKVKYTVDKISTITQGLFAEEVFGGFKPVAVSSKNELTEYLSHYITEEYQKKLFSEYDDDFFKENVLLFNFMIDSTASRKIELNDTVFSKDNISVYYTAPSTDFGICNTDYLWALQVTVPKSGYSGQKIEWKCMGDANGDGSFGIADIVTLQKWLAASSDTELSDLKAVDICEDDVIDVFDLVSMRKKLIEVHQLDKPVTYGIEAQYVRTNGYVDGAEYPQTALVTSTEELKEYIESHKDKYYMKSAEFNDAVEKYNDNWFNFHKLMIVLLEESSGSVSHGVTSVTNRSVTINRTVPEVGTCDMAEWHIFIEYPETANISDNFSVEFTNTYLR